ncbi:MAG: peptidoglycan DD-metalloendopeptidase family protein [Actinomycetota bacterium]
MQAKTVKESRSKPTRAMDLQHTSLAGIVRGGVICALVVGVLLAGVGRVGYAAGIPLPPQVPMADDLARLDAEANAVLTRVRAARGTLDQVAADFEKAGARSEETASQIVATQRRLQDLDSEMGVARAAINQRASSVYRSQRLALMEVLLSSRSYREFVAGLGFLKSVTIGDSKALTKMLDLKRDTARVRGELEAGRAEQQRVVEELSYRQRQLEGSLAALGGEYEKVRAELETRRSGFAFPVHGAYAYADSWGAPRMVGTRSYHRHQGTDIFALRGTPVVAVVNGALEKVGTDRLGGIKLWLRSPGDNWTYYYAHLSGYAPGIRNGLQVSKGAVLGYVGNTGNARSTPNHLHFETHVPSGTAVNPYPILRRVDPLGG